MTLAHPVPPCSSPSYWPQQPTRLCMYWTIYQIYSAQSNNEPSFCVEIKRDIIVGAGHCTCSKVTADEHIKRCARNTKEYRETTLAHCDVGIEPSIFQGKASRVSRSITYCTRSLHKVSPLTILPFDETSDAQRMHRAAEVSRLDHRV